MRERNLSIDLLKFIATFLILNSHMDMLYVHFPSLATGGAIGDVIFFFCSGFMLFQKDMGSFDNWYGNRINRIYPTVFAWAIISSFFFENHQNMKEIILYGGGGFVSAIMIYYILMYLINKYLKNKGYLVFLMVCCLIGILYNFFPYKYGVGRYGIYGDITNFRWVFYFLFILLGAYIGNGTIKVGEIKFSKDATLLILSIFLFYGIQLVAKKYNEVAPYQIFSILPLLSIAYYLYKISKSEHLARLIKIKPIESIVVVISGLTLEIYLVQFSLLSVRFNNLFPLNILLVTSIVLVNAYMLRCVSRLFIQTFRGNGYNWKQVFELY